MSAIIEDFIAIEFQTGQTSGTGALVQGLTDFMLEQKPAYKSYGFGLNTYDVWKRTFTQILNKGVIMENWGKTVYWVVQEPIYQNFEVRYSLQKLDFQPTHSTVFALYDLKPKNGRFELVASRKISASMDQLFAAFRNNPNIPNVSAFMEMLKGKIESGAQISLQLGRKKKVPAIDVKPPTASGKIHDAPNGEADSNG